MLKWISGFHCDKNLTGASM